ncbi:unnamed protein product [Parnassius mnemosyne]|uniref:Uncharacterized protein n=1 Tax=Parnassius mnemosyne TaxID=213953 RepID=A0AAV1LT45_9NEOP
MVNENNIYFQRDTVNLKRAWDNMKAFTRKARAAECGSLFKTGGSPVKPPLPPHRGAIISMVEEAAPVIICEVKNSFDSDGCLLSSLEEEEVKSSDCKIDDNEPNKYHLAESEKTLTAEFPIQVINNIGTQDEQNIPFSPTDCIPRKPADYIRREGVL